MEFAKGAVARRQPFYLNVWPDDVHSPYWPPVTEWAEGKRGLYHAVLQSMDQQLGRLFAFLRENSGVERPTLILVCSDNGPEPGAGSAGPFRGAKTQLYEGGHSFAAGRLGTGFSVGGKAGSSECGVRVCGI